MSTIALATGFNSTSALTAAFKPWSRGVAPSEYRKIKLAKAPAKTLVQVADIRAPRPSADVRGILLDVYRLAMEGNCDRATFETALGKLGKAEGLVQRYTLPELASHVVAHRGLVYHCHACDRMLNLDIDGAYADLAAAHSCYAVSLRLPERIQCDRERLLYPDDTRFLLLKELCVPCLVTLLADEGRSVREHLSHALQPLPNDLDWFQVCCEPCYRVVWQAAGKARLGLMDDAWKTVWLAAHAYPVEEVPPSLARYVQALHESESLTHKEQGPRLQLCWLAVETARELGDPLREAYALCFVANALRAMGRFEEAWRALRDAKVGCQANPWATAFHALMEGHLAAQEKMWQVALEQLGNARSLYSRLDSHLSAIPLVDQGAMFFDQGDYEASGRSYEEALVTLDHRRDPLLAGAVVPFNLAVALAVQRRTGDAKVALNRCEFDRAAEPGMVVNERFVAGCLELDNGRPEEALRLLGETAGLAESLDRLHDKALAIFYSVEAYAGLGNREKAIESAAEALGLFRALGCKQDTIEAFAKLRQQLEAAAIDAVAVAVTVRRLAQEQGGWLPGPSGPGEPGR